MTSTRIVIDNQVMTQLPYGGIMSQPFRLFKKFNPNESIDGLPRVSVGSKLADSMLIQLVMGETIGFNELLRDDIGAIYATRRARQLANLE